MTSQLDHPGTVIVSGDLTIDWNIAQIQKQRGSGVWATKNVARACWQPGGASLLAALVEAVADGAGEPGRPRAAVRTLSAPPANVTPADDRFNHSYAMFAPVDSGDKLPDGTRKTVWRATQFLGVDRLSDTNVPPDWNRVEQETDQADIVVLDDAALTFREQRALWPRAIVDSATRQWIVQMSASPVAR
jgi:hypothetical protein